MNARFFLILCIPFFAVSIFHLASCVLGKRRATDISKIMLMPLLLLAFIVFYFFATSSAAKTADTTGLANLANNIANTASGANSAWRLFYIGLLASLALCAGNAGDVFLLGEQVKTDKLAKGLLSFLAGHILYIIALVSFIPFYPVNLPLALAAAVLYTAGIVSAWLLSHKPKGVIGIGVIVYASVLGAFSYTAFLKAAGMLNSGHKGMQTAAALKIAAGTLFFLVSDGILSRTVFVKPFKQSRFVVMLTYIAAQFFIAWGFCTF